jgi:hypothetical protein
MPVRPLKVSQRVLATTERPWLAFDSSTGGLRSPVIVSIDGHKHYHEVTRARVVPADRAGVRQFLERFAGEDLEVALEATTGWRFVVEELEAVGARVHLAEPPKRQGCEATRSVPSTTAPTRGICESC